MLFSIPFWNLILEIPDKNVLFKIFGWKQVFGSIFFFSILGSVIGFFASNKISKTALVKTLNNF